MSKNVLVISSSPRRGGNSDVLCDQFCAGAQAAGHQSEKVMLEDLKIKFCTGCGYCTTHHKCALKDDMAALLDKMVKADVIVLATPVYFYSMYAQLKVMIDRVCPRYTELSDKQFYLIATAADSGETVLDGTIAGYKGFLDCLTNPTDAGVLVGVGLWGKDDVQTATAMQKKAYRMGEKC